MKRSGYIVGAFWPHSTNPREPFSDFNGLIAVMANHCAAARAFLDVSPFWAYRRSRVFGFVYISKLDLIKRVF